MDETPPTWIMLPGPRWSPNDPDVLQMCWQDTTTGRTEWRDAPKPGAHGLVLGDAHTAYAPTTDEYGASWYSAGAPAVADGTA